MKKQSVICAILVLLVFTVNGLAKRAMTPEDLYKIKSVSDPQISPDGQWITYTVSVPSLEKNNSNSDIWLIPVSGGTPIQLTNSPKRDSSPRWSPDGKTIAFISSRGGVSNLYLLPFRGGEAKKLTDSATGLYSPTWSKDGKFILCGSRVLPEGKKNLENWTKDDLPKCEARTIDHLLFRQWDSWLGDKRNHVFLVNVSDGSMTDLTPADADVPPVSLSSAHDFDISLDGKEVCYVRNDDPMLAISTNQDIFLLDVTTKKETRLTDNPALDHQPYYSPDGRYIAYLAMKKAGYEADRTRLTIYNRKADSHKTLTEMLDVDVNEILWAPDSRGIYFNAGVRGRSLIYYADLRGKVTRLTNEGYNNYLRVTPDNRRLVFRRSYNHFPYELFTMPVNLKSKKKAAARQLTETNAAFLAELELPQLEEFWFTGAENSMVHGYILRPPGFDPKKKYPAVLTIHGGPQNMWADRFMTAWFTFQLISSPGYVGVFINPRGSSGYGSAFREEVSKDYGGRCFEDLMSGMNYVVENYTFVDPERLAAIGGSFGGYSVNWIMSHTNRFKCIVSHAGLYHLESFYGATEELWYPAWDMGETPWDEPQIYKAWSPHHHAKFFKTPTLVTHGQMDFRVPFAQSLQLFTALQRQEIPSRLVAFPDEGHVISIPQNNVRWWKEIHRWFKHYLK